MLSRFVQILSGFFLISATAVILQSQNSHEGEDWPIFHFCAYC